MARKIRVTESELVNMIESIITKTKKDKNVIKLSEGDLKNIIGKVNGKINIAEEKSEEGKKGSKLAKKTISTYRESLNSKDKNKKDIYSDDDVLAFRKDIALAIDAILK